MCLSTFRGEKKKKGSREDQHKKGKGQLILFTLLQKTHGCTRSQRFEMNSGNGADAIYFHFFF